jgi:SAM-dependent methyltransferase
MTPPPSPALPPVAIQDTRAHYEAYPFIEGGPRRVAWWQEYLRAFLPDELVRGRLIGDIGSSVGEVSRGLANRGARLVCLDLTWSALQRCREINPEAECFHGNALDLPFANDAFDHTISIGVLMVTPDCRRGIHEVARVTAPGGRVVLFIYNSWSYLNLAYHLFRPIARRWPLAAVPGRLVRLLQPFVRSHLGERLDEPQLRRLLGDKLWTPHATFHSRRQIRDWADEAGLTLVRWQRFYHAYAHVMGFVKRGPPPARPAGAVRVRCLRCGHAPLDRTGEAFACDRCATSYERVGGIHRFLPGA